MKKITLLFALLACFSMTAQWTTDTTVNTLVAESTNTDSQSIGTHDGKTFIVFWKVVAAPTNYELRVQLLDADGVSQFGTDGMLISNTIPMSTSTVFWKLAMDKNNNLFVGVTGTGTGNPAMVYKISTTGTMLWGANGVNIGSGYLPTILPLDNGDVAISYWPGTKAKLQKYTSSGVEIWANAVDIVSSNASSATTPADLYEMPNGDITVIFHRKLSFGVASNLFAQRFNTDGVVQWAAPVQLTTQGTFYNAFYSGTQDGDVIYYGFSGGTASRFDSFIQRLNPDGTLPWGTTGIDFDTNQASYEMNTKIAFSSGSQYVWALSSYTPSTQDSYGQYVQKFDKATGARQFTDNAKQVFAIDSQSRVNCSDLKLIGDAPLFLMKSGSDNGVSPTTLNMVLLNTNGDFAWMEESLPVATFAANKGRITLNDPHNGQAVVSFSEAKVAGEPKMYAQNFIDPALAVNAFNASENDIQLYPNPSDGIFNIRSSEMIRSVKIYDMLGQLVYNGISLNVLQSSVNAASWAKGIYTVSIETAKAKQHSFKFARN